jgi:hypothetical protein
MPKPSAHPNAPISNDRANLKTVSVSVHRSTTLAEQEPEYVQWKAGNRVFLWLRLLGEMMGIITFVPAEPLQGSRYEGSDCERSNIVV